MELTRSLRSFSFEMPFVSEAGFEDLQRRHPDCHINRYRFQRSEHQAIYDEAMRRAIKRSPVPTSTVYINKRTARDQSVKQVALEKEWRLDSARYRAYDENATASGLLTVAEVEYLIERSLLEPEFRELLYRGTLKRKQN